MIEESFKIDQAKFNAITNEQLKHLFAWQEKTVEPAFKKLDREIEKAKDELREEIKDLESSISSLSVKSNTLIVLNITLLILVVGKSFPSVIKLLVQLL